MTECLTKVILVQYADLREEVKDLRKKIDSLEIQLKRMEEDGFPYPQYSRKKTLLYSRKAKLETLELDLLESINQAEEFISSLDDARIRRLLNLRFIEDLSWIQVAHRMKGYHTADSCRKAVVRFFEDI